MTGRHVASVVLLAAAGALTAAGTRDSLPPRALGGVLLGLILSAAGAVSWIVAVAATLHRGPQAFLAAVVLGILGRLVVYGATLAYVALGTTLDLVWTAGSLLVSYAVFIVLEIRFALVMARPGGSSAGGGTS